MKRPVWLLRLLLLSIVLSLAGGCARYKVTFTNQTTTTSRGRPKHDQKSGTITFKDAKGNKQTVPAFSVESIEPY
jgi:ABC-type Fe3+-hydroxamate transport system substrate-binding protein